MTIHVVVLCGSFVLHVSDRRLTTGTAGSAELHDPAANKTVVVVGSQGIVSLGYSGAAYLDRVPTDEWLARRVLGAQYDPAPAESLPWLTHQTSYGSFTGLSPGEVWGAVGTGVRQQMWRERADNRRNGLELVMAGWSWKRDRPERMRTLAAIARRRKGGRWRQDVGTRRVGAFISDGGLHVAAIGSRIVKPLLLPRLNDLLTNATRSIDLSDVEAVVADAIREAAATQAGDVIGTDLMSVGIGFNHLPVRCRYLPDPSGAGHRVAYSPWIITHGVVQPPQVMTGGGLPSLWHNYPDGSEKSVVEFSCDPPLPEGGPFGTRGQERVPPP